MSEPRSPLSTNCWRCLSLEQPAGATRLSLCETHLRDQVRRLMSLEPSTEPRKDVA